jgi:hypothetical protein
MSRLWDNGLDWFFQFGVFNPDSAVEREVMEQGETFRSEDNAFCL